MPKVTKYDLFRLKVGTIAALLGALGTQIPICIMLPITYDKQLAILFANVCLPVAAYLGGFFTDNVKLEEKKEDKVS